MCADALQNNLWYYALSNLDPITAAVTSQMKVITTAIASVLMLGRRLSPLQWLALSLLTVGMVVMQLQSHGSPRRLRSEPDRVVPQNSLHGAMAMLLSTVLSAYAGVFLEKVCVYVHACRARVHDGHPLMRIARARARACAQLFKTVKLTLWLQSIQLSVFALPVSCLCMLVYDAPTIFDHSSLLIGFNEWAWLTVGLSAVGGIAVSMALKYADNILKTFAVGCSIVLNACVSTLGLGVALTWQVVCGMVLVVSSTFLFNASDLGRQLRLRWSRGKPVEADAREMQPLRERCESSRGGGLPDERLGAEEMGESAGELHHRDGASGDGVSDAGSSHDGHDGSSLEAVSPAISPSSGKRPSPGAGGGGGGGGFGFNRGLQQAV